QVVLDLEGDAEVAADGGEAAFGVVGGKWQSGRVAKWQSGLDPGAAGRRGRGWRAGAGGGGGWVARRNHSATLPRCHFATLPPDPGAEAAGDAHEFGGLAIDDLEVRRLIE